MDLQETVNQLPYISYNELDWDEPQQLIRQNSSQLKKSQQQIRTILQQTYQTNLLKAPEEFQRNGSSGSQKKFESPLQQFEKMKNEKFDYIMSFETVNQNDKIIKDFGKQRCISSNNNFLCIGSSLGKIIVYNLHQTQNPILITLEKHYGSICSLDISDDGELVAVGFEQGAIGIVSISKQQYLKTCREIYKSRVLLIKFVYKKAKSKSSFSCITSDDQGNSRILHFSEDLVGLDYTIQLLFPKQDYPIVAISVLTNDLMNIYFKNEKEKRVKVIALSTIQQIWIIKVHKNIDAKFSSISENPYYTNLAWGAGFLPPQSNHLAEQWKKQKLVLGISWSTHLYFIVYQHDKQDKFYQMKPLLTIDDPIQFIGFIGNCVLQVITQNQDIFLLNTIDLSLHISPKAIVGLDAIKYDKKLSGKVFTSIYCIKKQEIKEDLHRSQSLIISGNTQSEIIQRMSSNDKYLIFDAFPFQNCSFAINENQVMILCEQSLEISSLNYWQDSIHYLIENRDWRSAMNLLISVKNGTIKFSPQVQKGDSQQEILKQVKEIASVYLKTVIDLMKQVLDQFRTLKATQDM